MGYQLLERSIIHNWILCGKLFQMNLFPSMNFIQPKYFINISSSNWVDVINIPIEYHKLFWFWLKAADKYS